MYPNKFHFETLNPKILVHMMYFQGSIICTSLDTCGFSKILNREIS
jgi:hypothetical protein